MSTADQLLRIIKRAGKITKPVLQIEYSLTVKKIGDAEFATALERLVDLKMVKGTTDEVTGDESLSVTAKGLNRVANL